MYGLVITSQPASEPVTLSEAKLQCRVTGTSEDTLLTRLITVAREGVESDQGRALITQTWKMTLDQFPSESTIQIPKPPLQSVSSITYKDTNGDSQTLDSSKYVVDTTTTLGGTVSLAYGQTWPSTYDEKAVVAITFVCGYGDADDVPESTKHAILMLIAELYETREATEHNSRTVAEAYKSLLHKNKVWGYA